jgi:hypothetical protein
MALIFLEAAIAATAPKARPAKKLDAFIFKLLEKSFPIISILKIEKSSKKRPKEVFFSDF